MSIPTLTEITQGYSTDYFDTNTLRTLELARELLESVELGTFEYDTGSTDYLLSALKTYINRVDI